MAEYTCVTYAEARLRAGVSRYAEARVRASADKPAALHDALERYGALLGDLCSEVGVQFQRHSDAVLSAYARQLSGGAGGDISTFLDSSRARRWASDNAAFLRNTARLVELYMFATGVAPELLDQPPPAIDSATFMEVSDTSVGAAAQSERLWLIRLLHDKRFSRYAPAGLDLEALAAEEERLRKASSTLRHATVFGWFNGNASDLARQALTSFDTMRSLGLVPILSRHEALFQRLHQEK